MDTRADPKLPVFRTNPLTRQNTGLFSRDNGSGSADAAFVVTLEPGVYTVVGSSADGVSTGVVLVEVYVVP